jgi:hypothetical protein
LFAHPQETEKSREGHQGRGDKTRQVLGRQGQALHSESFPGEQDARERLEMYIGRVEMLTVENPSSMKKVAAAMRMTGRKYFTSSQFQSRLISCRPPSVRKAGPPGISAGQCPASLPKQHRFYFSIRPGFLKNRYPESDSI